MSENVCLGSSLRAFLSQNPTLTVFSTDRSRSARGLVGGSPKFGGGETTLDLDGLGEWVEGVAGAKDGLNSFALTLKTNSFALGSSFLTVATGGLSVPGSRGVGLAIGDGLV